MVCGALIFAVSTWAVFSKHIDDGFIGRHLFAFTAISGAGYAYSGSPSALSLMLVLIITALLWMTCRYTWRLTHANQR